MGAPYSNINLAVHVAPVEPYSKDSKDIPWARRGAPVISINHAVHEGLRFRP